MKERIKELCNLKGISMNKLEETLGFGKGYISKLGDSTPNTAKIQKIADYFGVTVDYLMKGEKGTGYYLNSETEDMAQFLYDNPDYKVLFDASRKVKPEDIQFIKEMIDRMSDKE